MTDRPDDDAAAVVAMLDLVERDEAERTRSVLDDASSGARELVAAARATARTRVRQVIRDASDRARRRVEDVRAALATRRRQRDHELDVQRLDRAWDELADALVARWGDPAARERWACALIELGLRVLPAGRWTIEHSPDVPSRTLSSWAGRVRQHGGEPPVLTARPEIRCGLRLHVGGAVLDGTEVGLLADRRHVRSRLFRELATGGAS